MKKKKGLLIALSICALLVFACFVGCTNGKEDTKREDITIEQFRIPEQINAGAGSNFVLPSYFAIDNNGMRHTAKPTIYDDQNNMVEITNNTIRINGAVGSQYNAAYRVDINQYTEIRDMVIIITDDSAAPNLQLTKNNLLIPEKTLFSIANYYIATDDSGVNPIIKYDATLNGTKLTDFNGKPIVLSVGKYEFNFYAEDYSGNVSETVTLNLNSRGRAVIADFEDKGDTMSLRNGITVTGGSDTLSISQRIVHSGNNSVYYANTKNSTAFELVTTGEDGHTNGASIADSYAVVGFYMYYMPKDDSGYININYDSRKYEDWHWLNAVGEMSFYVDGQLVETGVANGRKNVKLPTEQWVYIEYVILEYYKTAIILKPEGYSDYIFEAYIDDFGLATEASVKNSIINKYISNATDKNFVLKDEVQLRLRDYSQKSSWNVPEFEVYKLNENGEDAVQVIDGKFEMSDGEYHIYYINSDRVRSGAYTKLIVSDSLFDSVSFSKDINKAENINIGVVDKKYDCLTATSNLDSVKLTKKVLFENKEVALTGDSFTPKKAGEYTVRYTATKGDVSEDKEIKINVIPTSSYEELTAEVETSAKKTVNCGEKILTPLLETSGGLGEIKVVVKLGDKVINNDFILEEVGEYKLSYYVTDKVQTKKIDFTFNAVNSTTPILMGEEVYPSSYINNSEYTLKALTAILYTSSGKTEEELTVKWVYKNVETTLINGKFTPKVDNNGETITIKYYVGSQLIKESEPITVVKTLNDKQVDILKYFISNNVDLTIGVNSKEDDGITFTSKGVSEATFINSLLAKDFNVVFGVAKDVSASNTITFLIEDVLDPSVSIEFTVTTINGKARISINKGAPINFVGLAMGTTMNRYQISYNNYSFNVNDVQGDNVTTITRTLNGKEFTGFPSKLVKLSILGKNNSSKFKLFSINKQLMKNLDEDILPPQIDINSMDLSVTLNQKVMLPQIIVSDVLDPNAKITVSVLTPSSTSSDKKYADGIENVIFNNQEFTAKELGVYSIEFTYVDWNMNDSKFSLKMYVIENESPKLSLDGKIPETIKLGKTIKLPIASATDNATKEVKIQLYVTSPNGQTQLFNGEEFTPTMKGEYLLKYYAFDESSNYDIVEYKLSVN